MRGGQMSPLSTFPAVRSDLSLVDSRSCSGRVGRGNSGYLVIPARSVTRQHLPFIITKGVTVSSDRFLIHCSLCRLGVSGEWICVYSSGTYINYTC
ncbi:hypothetical protein BDV11DRAFT_199394 [Aspergillus similis]